MRPRIKPLLFSIVLGLSVVLGTTSCETQRQAIVNQQVSTYSVQAAEHTLRAAKDTFDTFFSLVHQNHAFVEQSLPQVYAFAVKWANEDTGIKPLLQRADRAKNAFKHNRTSDNQTSLNTVMNLVAQLMADANRNMTKVQTATP